MVAPHGEVPTQLVEVATASDVRETASGQSWGNDTRGHVGAWQDNASSRVDMHTESGDSTTSKNPGFVETVPLQAPAKEIAFEPRHFVGNWFDSIGHSVVVTSSGTRGGKGAGKKGGRGGKKGSGECNIGFLATLTKARFPEKCFTIAQDRGDNVWTCGNGTLLVDECTSETIVWLARDGRKNRWKRAPPEGPVYFDAPPAEASLPLGPSPAWFAYHRNMNKVENNVASTAAAERIEADPWNVSAPEFRPSPKLGTKVEIGRPPIFVRSAGSSPDVEVSGPGLEWCIPEDWGQLRSFPKDTRVTSPMFGIQQSSNIQLNFYPNGTRTSEHGRCTVALTRGPGGAGIKFEILVNGRGIGPKVCLGRRYMGDYALPYGDDNRDASQKVNISIKVLDVLGN